MPPRLRKCFQSCRDVYTVAVDIAVLNDNVAGINADPKLAPIARDACVTVNHSSLHRNGTTAGELLHAADLAVYQAKAAGRNRVAVAP